MRGHECMYGSRFVGNFYPVDESVSSGACYQANQVATDSVFDGGSHDARIWSVLITWSEDTAASSYGSGFSDFFIKDPSGDTWAYFQSTYRNNSKDTVQHFFGPNGLTIPGGFFVEVGGLECFFTICYEIV